jgi:hypothetical protein
MVYLNLAGTDKIMLPQESESTPFLKNSFCFPSFRDKSGDFHDPLRKKTFS